MNLTFGASSQGRPLTLYPASSPPGGDSHHRPEGGPIYREFSNVLERYCRMILTF